MSLTNAIKTLEENYSYDTKKGNFNGFAIDLSDGIDASDLEALVNAYKGNAEFDINDKSGVDSDDAQTILESLLSDSASDTNAPTSSRTVLLPGSEAEAKSLISSGNTTANNLITDINSKVVQEYTEGYHYEKGMSGMMCGMATEVIDVKGDSLLDKDSNAAIDDLNGNGTQGDDEDIVIANAFMRGLQALESSGDGKLSVDECKAKDTDGNGIISGSELGLEDFNFQFAYKSEPNSEGKEALTLTLKSQDGVQSFVSLKECTQGTDGQIDLTSMGLAKASEMVNAAYKDYLERMVVIQKSIAMVMDNIKNMNDADEAEVTDEGVKVNGAEVPGMNAETVTQLKSLGITNGKTTVGAIKAALEQANTTPAPAAEVIAPPVSAKTDTTKTDKTTTDTAKTDTTTDTTKTSDTTDTTKTDKTDTTKTT